MIITIAAQNSKKWQKLSIKLISKSAFVIAAFVI